MNSLFFYRLSFIYVSIVYNFVVYCLARFLKFLLVRLISFLGMGTLCTLICGFVLSCRPYRFRRCQLREWTIFLESIKIINRNVSFKAMQANVSSTF